MTAYVFLAEGFETVEALGTADVLRRGGMDVRLVSADSVAEVASSHGIRVCPDMSLGDVLVGYDDIMIFPGGMPGTKNLAANAALIDMAREHFAAGGRVAAICAAPGLVLSQLGDMQGVRFTCFDGFQEMMVSKGAIFVERPSVVHGNVISARSAAYFMEFGASILSEAVSPDVAERVVGAMRLAVDAE